jgi:glycine dehydrogenase
VRERRALPTMSHASFDQAFPRSDGFVSRHLGPAPDDVRAMLEDLGAPDLATLMQRVIPQSIRYEGTLETPAARGENEVLEELRALEQQNQVWRSFIGLGYHAAITPGVILRNVLENPGWYTQYTPYQAEISQGRLEALLNYQTAVLDLTGLQVSNASLLDEATAAAESMTMCKRVLGKKADGKDRFLVAPDVHPQTIALLRTRAEPQGIEVVVADPRDADLGDGYFGALLQYPATDGSVVDLRPFCKRAHEHDMLVTVATDLLALTMLESPGAQGADVAIGNSQRFGVPLGYGGPHAAFMATRDDFKRQMPGRIIGVTKDAQGNHALRMALQTREQHIRRDKATSNICTAQVLLAVMAGFYAVYHGPEGLTAIAKRTRALTAALGKGLDGHAEILTRGFAEGAFFDTLQVQPKTRSTEQVLAAAASKQINLRRYDDGSLGVALDETTDPSDVADILSCFGVAGANVDALVAAVPEVPGGLRRTADFMTHPVFNSHRSETEMLRYIHRLQAKDLSLTHEHDPARLVHDEAQRDGEMLPVTWPEFSQLHPFARAIRRRATRAVHELERWLARSPGFAAVSLQPNAGSQGEYAGLLAIRAYHRAAARRSATSA